MGPLSLLPVQRLSYLADGMRGDGCRGLKSAGGGRFWEKSAGFLSSPAGRTHPGGGQLGDGTQAAEPSHPRPSQATLEQPTGGQAQSRMVTPLNHVTLNRDAHASKIGAP